jgi:hypothetical protein
MSERHYSFRHQLANGELDDEERELVLAELYGSGMFDDALSWYAEGQPDAKVEGAGDVDGCTPRVGGSEHTGGSDGSDGPSDPGIDDGPTLPVGIQEVRGVVVPFASAAPDHERGGGEPEDVGERSGDKAIKLPRVAVQR